MTGTSLGHQQTRLERVGSAFTGDGGWSNAPCHRRSAGTGS